MFYLTAVMNFEWNKRVALAKRWMDDYWERKFLNIGTFVDG